MRNTEGFGEPLPSRAAGQRTPAVLWQKREKTDRCQQIHAENRSSLVSNLGGPQRLIPGGSLVYLNLLEVTTCWGTDEGSVERPRDAPRARTQGHTEQEHKTHAPAPDPTIPYHPCRASE